MAILNASIVFVPTIQTKVSDLTESFVLKNWWHLFCSKVAMMEYLQVVEGPV